MYRCVIIWWESQTVKTENIWLTFLLDFAKTYHTPIEEQNKPEVELAELQNGIASAEPQVEGTSSD